MSRLDLDLVSPPLSVISLMNYISSKEGLSGPCEVFTDRGAMTPLSDGDILADQGHWPGSTRDDYIMFKSRSYLPFEDDGVYSFTSVDNGCYLSSCHPMPHTTAGVVNSRLNLEIIQRIFTAARGPYSVCPDFAQVSSCLFVVKNSNILVIYSGLYNHGLPETGPSRIYTHSRRESTLMQVDQGSQHVASSRLNGISLLKGMIATGTLVFVPFVRVFVFITNYRFSIPGTSLVLSSKGPLDGHGIGQCAICESNANDRAQSWRMTKGKCSQSLLFSHLLNIALICSELLILYS